MEGIAIIVVSAISIIGNVIQYLLNKKNTDIDSLDKQFKLFKDFQLEKDKEQREALTERDKNINILKERVSKQEIELIKLRKLFIQMLKDGCHVTDCPNKESYSIAEINKYTTFKNI